MHALLEMTDISKSFPGVKALDQAKLTVRAGTVHALMGENGAGKSTLMKCLFGIYHPDEGSIRIEGEEVRFTDPHAAMEFGVAMVHQELSQAETRSVMDNIWLGRYPTRLGLVSDAEMRRNTLTLFHDLGIHVDPDARIGSLPVAERQMVEIARAVSCHAKLLVLDEPTSSLTSGEVEHLFRIIRRLKERGVGIIYISHKMAEILAISDEVTIMRDGHHISTDPAGELTMDEIIRRMVGRELTGLYPTPEGEVGEELLRVSHLTTRYRHVKDVSFTLHRGEILGFAGLVGAGRTDLLEALFGLTAVSEGEVFLNGEPLSVKRPHDAIRAGLALLTEERRATGIFGGLSVQENTCIANLHAYRRGPVLTDAAMRRDTRSCIDAMRVKTPSHMTPIRALSGGNQQKIILGRWLLTKPSVLMLDEPTRGVDVGAKYEIYRLIHALRKEGRGIIVVSSEMPELLGISDRIIVMSGGRIAGELSRENATQEAIMALSGKYV